MERVFRIWRVYRKFIRNFGAIAASLTSLLKKEAFGWNSEAGESFEHLKKALTETPVLAMPSLSQPFVIECDASGHRIGVVLMQSDKPIAFPSQRENC